MFIREKELETTLTTVGECSEGATFKLVSPNTLATIPMTLPGFPTHSGFVGLEKNILIAEFTDNGLLIRHVSGDTKCVLVDIIVKEKE